MDCRFRNAGRPIPRTRCTPTMVSKPALDRFKRRISTPLSRLGTPGAASRDHQRLVPPDDALHGERAHAKEFLRLAHGHVRATGRGAGSRRPRAHACSKRHPRSARHGAQTPRAKGAPHPAFFQRKSQACRPPEGALDACRALRGAMGPDQVQTGMKTDRPSPPTCPSLQKAPPGASARSSRTKPATRWP